MPPSHARTISHALRRLRLGVFAYAWIIGLTLVIHVLVWSLATYTDMRFDEIEASVDRAAVAQPTVVTSSSRRPTVAAPSVPVEAASGEAPVNPNRVPGRMDRVFALAVAAARGLGTLAAIALVIVMAMGMVMAAGGGVPGVEKTASAFMWSLVVAMLVLPMGTVLTLPWPEGALNSYEAMIAAIDAREKEILAGAFYSRFLLMPLACIVGTFMVSLRFSAGVEAALLPREAILDPALEAEASNIKASSLQGGGRSAGALERMVKQDMEPATPAPTATPAPAPAPAPPAPATAHSARSVSPGAPQRRLI
ncbi:MAG: hypothetical protein ACYTG1_06935 [Planctomycetota bacterium]|jgi:hypothetical protein